MQMICALLIFQTPDLPAPLPELSQWLEAAGESRDEAYDRLARQEHRRFIKAHLPLSEIPIDSGVTYIAVARHPLDTAISLYHYREEIRRTRMRKHPPPAGSPAGGPPRERLRSGGPAGDPSGGDPAREWLLRWIADTDVLPQERRESLPGVMCHMTGAWARRSEPNVRLVHYEELSADLEREMRQLAAHLRISVPESVWPTLVNAASFGHMRAAAGGLQPSHFLKENPEAHFRKGVSGLGRELLSSAELAQYYQSAAQMAPSDLLSWLHRDSEAS
jgi:hypothetical protein